MITRIWHGYTTFENADAYEQLLKTKIFPFIEARAVPGYKRIELYKQLLESEAEFITIMWFDTLEDIKNFAGPNYDTAVVLPAAKVLLKRFDARSQHYSVCESLNY